MGRGIPRSYLFPATCLVAFVAVLAAAPTQAGRTVALAEAERVQGAASCGGPAMSTSTWCSVVCTWGCFGTGCAACGCPELTDPTSGIYQQNTTPCYVGASGTCGGYYYWSNTCTGS